MNADRMLKRAFVLASTVSAMALGAGGQAAAQEAAATTEDTIIVTATRRAVDIQDVPLNIAAVGGDTIEQLGAADLSELSQYVPGLHVLNQGGRSSNPIVVRGLNADPNGSNDGANDGGGTVATYLGEVPIFVDLRLNDMERVEVLMGPQGTLYGAGTLGGAIRYIPNRPDFTAPTMQVRGDAYGYSHGEGISSDVGVTMNAPLTDTFAIRASVDFLQDAGFIDYNYVVQEPGVSDPDPDFSDPAAVAANLAPVDDANTQDVFSGRIAARWNPISQFDAVLTYYFQDAEYGGRTISHRRNTLATPEYVSAKRVLEPNTRNNRLLSLEMSYDLGWGELTSATGFSEYEEEGQRDQSDLLIGLQYSYELFPTFTAYTLEESEEETVTQEIRLVSDFDGPLNFIVGGFYNHFDAESSSKEFTPFYAEYLTGDPATRPDNLEYFSFTFAKLIETAVYGEVTYDLTSNWDVTLGGRWYSYDLQTDTAVDLPLLNSAFYGAGPTDISLNFTPADQSDEGFLYKFNTSYDFSDDMMGYFTISQGYRIGNTNGLEACEVPPSGSQSVCASPGEEEYTADQTTNYELGLRSEWLDGALTLNGSIFYIDWTDPQVQSATAIGQQPINVNAAGARSLGFDTSLDWDITENFNLRAAYAYTSAELTADAPRLVRTVTPGTLQPVVFIDGEDGDRLPGSPEHQGSLYATYTLPAGEEWDWNFSYGFTYTGDVESRTGGRGGGITLPSYTIHNAAVRLQGAQWSVTLYADNLLDEFAETNAVSSPLFNQVLADDGGDPVYLRTFYTDVLPPRQIGIRFVRNFGG